MFRFLLSHLFLILSDSVCSSEPFQIGGLCRSKQTVPLCLYLQTQQGSSILPGEEEGPYIMDKRAAQINTPHVPEQDVPSQGMS